MSARAPPDSAAAPSAPSFLQPLQPVRSQPSRHAPQVQRSAIAPQHVFDCCRCLATSSRFPLVLTPTPAAAVAASLSPFLLPSTAQLPRPAQPKAAAMRLRRQTRQRMTPPPTLPR